MSKYKVGIVGYGWVAGAHIAAINATGLAEVTAVYSSRKLDPSEVSSRHGRAMECYQDLSKLLREAGVDVVSICSYPYEHSAQSIAAAKAGKHLIIEKPLALSWKDCLDIEAAVQESGVRSCVCFECRYSSQFVATKATVDRGLLGKIHYAEVDYFHGIGPWYGQYRWNVKKNAGGSSLLSAGCHAMDGMLLLMGTDVDTVSSYSTFSGHESFATYEYPTTSVTILRFKDGRAGKVASVIDCLQPYYFHIHLVGSKGSLLDNKFYSGEIAGIDRNSWSQLSMKMLDSGDVSDHPYQTQFQAFFEALKRDEEMPLTSLRDALHTHRTIFAADRSAVEGRPVQVSEMHG